MGCRSSTIQQSGLGQKKRTTTNRSDLFASLGEAGNVGDELLVARRMFHRKSTRDEQYVGP